MARRSPVDGAVVPAAAFVALLGWDGVRVWLPSILFIAGDAGTTSATVLGAIALGTALVPVVVVFLVPSAHGVWGWLCGIGLMAAGRLALQAAAGGAAQLAGSTLMMVGAGIAIGALAAHARVPSAARLGILIGVAASSALHAMFGTVDLAWQDGPFAWAATVVLVVALLAAAARATPSLLGEHPSTPAWPWWTLGPAFVLFGVLVAPPGRVAVATGWSDARVAATVVTMCGLPVLGAIITRRFSPRVSTPVAAALVLVGTAGALRASAWTSVVAQALLALGVGIAIGSMATTSRASARRRAAGGAGALFGFVAVGFTYYAPYDLVLPYPSRGVLLAAAVMIAGASLAVTISRTAEPVRERAVVARSLAVMMAITLTATVAFITTPRAETAPPTPSAPGEPVRVVLYNVHMGYDVRGTLAIEALADVIAELEPDVVVLNEVDRGWLTTGSRDTLRILQRQLGMPYHFAPAADEVWGNAVLSRYPMSDVRVERLSRGRDAMARSQITVHLEISPNVHVAVIGTHLSHVDVQGDTRLPQARTVAANLARLRDRGVPVILAGDLNAEPGSTELATFGELVQPTLQRGLPTWPSWSPRVQIDHVLVSDELEVQSVRRIANTHSDHFGIMLDVALRPDPQDS